MKALPENILILARINRKLFFLFFNSIFLVIALITLLVIQSKKTIKVVYQEHTSDLNNPIININSTDEKLSASKLYEENNIIKFLEKCLLQINGKNPYVRQLALLYMTDNVRQYYDNNIHQNNFYVGQKQNELRKKFTRNIQIKSIRELSNPIITKDNKIQKAYQLEIEILEFPPETQKQKKFSTPAQINIIFSYFDDKEIKELEKKDSEFATINPLNLKIISLFIAIK